MNFNMLEMILMVLFLALLASVLFRYLRLPVVLGYIVVGAFIGPHALGLISDIHYINEIAQLGIVFLLFTIGLEFSLPRLIAMKSAVFILGGLQVFLTIVITTFVGLWIEMDLLSSVIIGGIVAMSSTAIVTRQLSEQSELYTEHGLNAFGILLFQDLSVIPLIILIASLPLSQDQSLLVIFSWTIVKSILAIALIFILGRYLLQPLFRFISAVNMTE